MVYASLHVCEIQNQKEKRLGMDGSDDVSFPSLSAVIQRRLNAETPQYSRRRCIYRVPNILREANEQCYTPLIVSIGPLHHNDKKLLPMESHKLKYLQFFLGDPDPCANANLLNSCLKLVKGRENEIRECYADPIYLSSDDFTQMVLIDSVFVIQFFLLLQGFQAPEDDYIFNSPFLYDSVLRDLKLEENQLPFFLLDQLYCAKFATNATSSNPSPASFMEIVCKGLRNKLCSDNDFVIGTYTYPKHLLHLVALESQYQTSKPPVSTATNTSDGNRNFFHSLASFVCLDQPAPNSPQTATNIQKKITTLELIIFPPATQLHEAGVKFQVIEDSSCLLDITFDKGILKIPELQVSDDTEFMCRNLIAFEQCHYDCDDTCYFTDYHVFLNWLINTPEDVQLLVNAGIIKNFMGSPQQVSDLFNSLDTHAYTSGKRYSYEEISSQLRSHCKKRWNGYRATLIHTYFNHPWAAISVAYAIVLLLLTIAQVVLGIMAIPK